MLSHYDIPEKAKQFHHGEEPLCIGYNAEIPDLFSCLSRIHGLKTISGCLENIWLLTEPLVRILISKMDDA
jgi:hypothetical protein